MTCPLDGRDPVAVEHERRVADRADLRVVRDLTNRGLRSAVESLTARLPLVVSLDIAPQRFAPALEAAAYFVIAESLTNVIKHASTDEASVRVAPAGWNLLVEIRDEGRGGADPRRGSGLRGLEDRVDALNGTLSMSSPQGRGTRLRIELPIPERGRVS